MCLIGAFSHAGEVATITNQSNSVKTTYAYDSHGRVAGIVHDKLDTSTTTPNDRIDIVTFAYEYDAAHNRTRAEERWKDLEVDPTPSEPNAPQQTDLNILITSWTFDALNRPTSETFRTISDAGRTLYSNGRSMRSG